ncbi:hypothetical protein AQUCO_06200019v1 [Aquilegia coerulea]|uniref:Uncharacterized protein n=1 Tax=Aquilegia coerulea TaxID=218851 RepID=A0A2G5CD02_AQUCA|nr:hypothetical protein AQUCO_06200019v1 [Aquilegia coerulea]
MGRAPCCDKANVKKGPWSPEEDSKLKDYIDKHGTGGNWIALPQKAGLKRCGKSCRLRWLNYLRPNIKHGEFSDDEDRIICSLFASIGSRWSIIAAQLPGRTDNDIKNYWNTKLKKKLMGVVPSSHRKPPQPHFPSFQTPSSASLPYRSCNYNTTYYTPNRSFTGLDQPTSSVPSSFLNNSTTTTTTLFQPQESLLGSMQPYHPVKDHLLIMFGGEPSCSSSDGSCNQISYVKEMEYDQHGANNASGGVGRNEQVPLESYFFNNAEENQKLILNGSSTAAVSNGLWGETSIDYGVDQDIKQFVNNHSSSSSSSNFLFDENKTQGKVMYF